ncbi:MAG TPA: 1,4-dihydroxy-2-naphthoate octaprenyltransferase [Candidatus Sulfotelmatobacter sp.]|nr:1,4-dihydroxy-2-naphthoate octaprenyltransferase [Candidatus Sulfotelmatobacter sp.]
MRSLRLWMLAVRPRTLTLAAVPVAVGCAIAQADAGALDWPLALAALLGAVLIQAATNLHNDAADGESGADGPDRLGPLRVTAQGLLSAAAVRRAAWGCFGLAALAGLPLMAAGGWPILLLGVFSILAGWVYTGGPKPIAYTPLGELFVLAFFGVGAVEGTVWLQLHRLSLPGLLGGVAVGLFASAVLLTNNHRDSVQDARAGRRTLAILAGGRLTPRLYGLFMLAPFLLLPGLDAAMPKGHAWLALGALPLAWKLSAGFASVRGRGYNPVLGATAQTQLLFGLLLCFGLLL